MTTKQVYKEMKDTFGFVPTFFKSVPEDVIVSEWQLYKRIELEEGIIPGKYRQLMGVAIAAATKCRYCVFFHTQMAVLNGATIAEIDEALLFAKSTTGWSTYINGLGLDFEEFKKEVLTAVDHAMKNSIKKAA